MRARRADFAADPWRPFELAPGVLAAFTSRHGGVSAPPFDTLNLGGGVGDDPAAVTANRELAAAACGQAADAVAWMRQVHGRDVAYAAAGSVPAPGQHPAVDALFTDVAARTLGVLVADCAPVLIADPQARVIGAAHAGREGMAAGIAPALVRAMTGAGADPARMHAVIGPAICGGCYEVPAALQDAHRRRSPGGWLCHQTGQPGNRHRLGSRRAAGGGRGARRQPRSAVHRGDPGAVLLPP